MKHYLLIVLVFLTITLSEVTCPGQISTNTPTGLQPLTEIPIGLKGAVYANLGVLILSVVAGICYLWRSKKAGEAAKSSIESKLDEMTSQSTKVQEDLDKLSSQKPNDTAERDSRDMLGKLDKISGEIRSLDNRVIVENSFSSLTRGLSEIKASIDKPANAITEVVNKISQIDNALRNRDLALTSQLPAVTSKISQAAVNLEAVSVPLKEHTARLGEIRQKLDASNAVITLELPRQSATMSTLASTFQQAEKRCSEERNKAAEDVRKAELLLTQSAAEQTKLEKLKREADASVEASQKAKGEAEKVRQEAERARAALNAEGAWVEEERRGTVQDRKDAQLERQRAGEDLKQAETARRQAVDRLEESAVKERQAADKLAAATTKEIAVAAKEQGLKAEIAVAENLRNETKELKEQAANNNIAAEKARRDAATDLAASNLARSDAQARLASAESLTDSLWPDMMRRNGLLFDSRAQIEAHISAGSGEAGFLIASLFRLRVVASRVASQPGLAEEWPDVLSEVSRAGYRYWKACGYTPAQTDGEVKRWAEVMGQLVAPNYTIKVASPGLPKDSTWMNFKPGPPPHIVEVETWSVINQKNIAVKRAEVS